MKWAKLDEGKVVEIVEADAYPASDEPGISYCPATPATSVGKVLTMATIAAANAQWDALMADRRREAERAEDERTAAQEAIES